MWLLLLAPLSVYGAPSRSTDTHVIVRAPVDLADLLLEYNRALRPAYPAPTNITASVRLADASWSRGTLRLQLHLTHVRPVGNADMRDWPIPDKCMPSLGTSIYSGPRA